MDRDEMRSARRGATAGGARRSAGGAAGGRGRGVDTMEREHNRRDSTEKGEATNRFTRHNYGQTANDFVLTKATVGTAIIIAIFGFCTFFFHLGFSFIIGFVAMLAFWLLYFIVSIIKMPMMPTMKYEDKCSYFTYELTDEYKERNVALNDFRKLIAERLITGDSSIYLDDVFVEISSMDPLIFDFYIRGSVTSKKVHNEVPTWNGKFGCQPGVCVDTGNNSWRVVYMRRGMWETLDGRKVTPNDAVGQTKTPSVGYNPIGIRTDTLSEVHITNADQHTVITGDSGYGKSNTFNLILKNLFDTNALLLFFDAKQVEAPAVNDRCYAIITYDQAKAWQDAINDEMTRRSTYLTKKKAKKFLPPELAKDDPDALPFSNDYPPIVLAIDECGMWVTNPNDLQRANAFKKFIENVSRIGRSSGVTLICGSQRPRDMDIPDLVKQNASQYIAFHQSPQTVNLAFAKDRLEGSEANPSSIPSKGPGGTGGVGQFGFSSSETEDNVVPVKSYYVTNEELINLAHETKNKKKENLRIVQQATKLYEKEKAKSKDPDSLPISLMDPTIPATLE